MKIAASMRALLLVVLMSSVVSAQEDVTPPPLPPPDPVPLEQPPQEPQQLPPVLVPQTIANPPLPPEPSVSNGPPAAPQQPREARFGFRFGPMGHLAFNSINAAWDKTAVLPGFAGTIGLRFGMLRRNGDADFNIAAGAFFGIDVINFVPTLSPGLRLELLGARGPVLIPYLSLSLFTQLLMPMPVGQLGVRSGIALSWNLLALPGSGKGGWNWGGGGWGGGSGAWILIPIAIVAALIAFGDVRLYLQTDPRGALIYGLGIGIGF